MAYPEALGGFLRSPGSVSVKLRSEACFIQDSAVSLAKATFEIFPPELFAALMGRDALAGRTRRWYTARYLVSKKPLRHSHFRCRSGISILSGSTSDSPIGGFNAAHRAHPHRAIAPPLSMLMPPPVRMHVSVPSILLKPAP